MAGTDVPSTDRLNRVFSSAEQEDIAPVVVRLATGGIDVDDDVAHTKSKVLETVEGRFDGPETYEGVDPDRIVKPRNSRASYSTKRECLDELHRTAAGIEDESVSSPYYGPRSTRLLAQIHVRKLFPNAPDEVGEDLFTDDHNAALLRLGMAEAGYDDAVAFADDLGQVAMEVEEIDRKNADSLVERIGGRIPLLGGGTDEEPEARDADEAESESTETANGVGD